MKELKEIQKMVMNEMKRLDDNDYMKENNKNEVSRANALSQNATVFIKTINASIRLEEMKKNIWSKF